MKKKIIIILAIIIGIILAFLIITKWWNKTSFDPLIEDNNNYKDLHFDEHYDYDNWKSELSEAEIKEATDNLWEKKMKAYEEGMKTIENNQNDKIEIKK